MKNNKNTIQRNISFSKKFDEDIKNHFKEFGYNSYAELVRESVREKVYGKNLREELINKFLTEIETEKDFLFEENKNIYKKLLKFANKKIQ